MKAGALAAEPFMKALTREAHDLRDFVPSRPLLPGTVDGSQLKSVEKGPKLTLSTESPEWDIHVQTPSKKMSRPVRLLVHVNQCCPRNSEPSSVFEDPSRRNLLAREAICAEYQR
jgi:hypothetical protein